MMLSKGLNLSLITGLLIVVQGFCTIVTSPSRKPVNPQKNDIELIYKPDLLLKGDTSSFMIKTTPGSICVAGVGYWKDPMDKWVTVDFGDLIADPVGICEWEWQVPLDAREGIAEFRAAVEKDGDYSYLVPCSFCIEKCPWEEEPVE